MDIAVEVRRKRRVKCGAGRQEYLRLGDAARVLSSSHIQKKHRYTREYARCQSKSRSKNKPEGSKLSPFRGCISQAAPRHEESRHGCFSVPCRVVGSHVITE